MTRTIAGLLTVGLLLTSAASSLATHPWRYCRVGERGYWAGHATAQGLVLLLATVAHGPTHEQLECIVHPDATITVSSPSHLLAERVSCRLAGWLYASATEGEVMVETAQPPGCAELLRLDGHTVAPTDATVLLYHRVARELILWTAPPCCGWLRWHYVWGAQTLLVQGQDVPVRRATTGP